MVTATDPTTSAASERNIGRLCTGCWNFNMHTFKNICAYSQKALSTPDGIIILGDPELTAHDPAEDGASPTTTAADHFFSCCLDRMRRI